MNSALDDRSGMAAAVLALAVLLAFGPNVVAAPPSTPLISTGSVWKYLDTGANLGTAWRTTGYDDSAWPAGVGKFGFGEGDENTVLNIGSNNGPQIITYYFRHRFTIPHPSTISNLVLRLLRDDGAVVYLNGTEIRRDKMPAYDITYSTFASLQTSDTEERSYLAAQIPPALLRPGANLLAVEVHQFSADSGDLGFNLELMANTPMGLPLAVALDATNLVWRTGGDAPWFGQTQTTRDGVDAAQSGHVPQGSSSWLETTVNGPGLLHYAFQVRTEHINSTLRLLVDGAAVHIFSLHLGWSGDGHAVPAGRHTLRWLLENPANGGGSAVAWLDEVLYAQDAPNDTDGDGVGDDRDQCPDTPTGAVVNADGCSLAQLCPCEGPWPNHGEYVRCVITHAWQFFRAGLISPEQRQEYVRTAIRSDCGRREHEPVQLHLLPLTPGECSRDGFQFILSGDLDAEGIIEGSSDLQQWLPVQTNQVTITGSEIICPLDDARVRFFRIRRLN